MVVSEALGALPPSSANQSSDVMITVVSGLVGHGKSYDVVDMMCDHIAAGGIVATNIRLNLDRIREDSSAGHVPNNTT